MVGEETSSFRARKIHSQPGQRVVLPHQIPQHRFHFCDRVHLPQEMAGRGAPAVRLHPVVLSRCAEVAQNINLCTGQGSILVSISHLPVPRRIHRFRLMCFTVYSETHNYLPSTRQGIVMGWQGQQALAPYPGLLLCSRCHNLSLFPIIGTLNANCSTQTRWHW